MAFSSSNRKSAMPWPVRSCPHRWGRGTGTIRSDGSGRRCLRRARERRTASDSGDGFLLADHTLAEVVLHVQQLLVFALHQAADGNAGPVGDDGVATESASTRSGTIGSSAGLAALASADSASALSAAASSSEWTESRRTESSRPPPSCLHGYTYPPARAGRRAWHAGRRPCCGQPVPHPNAP